MLPVTLERTTHENLNQRTIRLTHAAGSGTESGDGYVSLKDIAQRQDVSKKYLEQIVPLLNKSNMLRTNRGYQGGYRLSKAPEEYTVGEVLRITEGDLAPVACLQTGVVDCPVRNSA